MLLPGVVTECSSDALPTRSAQYPEHGVPQRRHHLRCRVLADLTGILPERHVSHVVQPVLDAPVSPDVT